jgi:probable F420-dependent oxidoreductase
MQYGTGFSLTALPDPVAVRDIAQALDGAGFDFTGVGGHVLSQPLGTHEGRPPMTYVGPFYDHIVMFSYLAAVTQRIHFVSSIIILPEWPTAIVAKQGEQLQFFSGGRFQLGIGISWSEPEYQAMGQNIKNRGRRLEEQVQVLRRMWSEPFVTFDGRYHKLDNIGLNRLPSVPIPIWFGTSFDEKVMRRVSRLADGWMPLGDPSEQLPRMRKLLEEAGRAPDSLMVRANVAAGEGGAAAWVEAGKRLQAAGVTHINIGAPPDLAPAAALQRVIEARAALAGALG